MKITIPRKLRKIDDELWRVIPNSHKLYQVSNYGRVKSFVNDKKNGKILKGGEINGFKLIQISTSKMGSKKFYVHKLVAEAWLPNPNPQNTIVTHLDGVLTNNHVSNLEWHTRETLIEKHRELAKKQTNSPKFKRVVSNSKLQESDIAHLKSMLQKGVAQSKIAKMFCISEMQVTRIKRGENWGHVKPK